jgi:hypothetical protein
LNSREVAYKYRLSQWTSIIRECRSSGQTIAVWCEEHKVKRNSYYYWLKRVRDAACEALPDLNADNNVIVPVNFPHPTAATCFEDQNSPSALIVRLGSVTLEISNTASAALIENTLKALQHVR